MVFMFGKTAAHMKDSTKMIRNMGSASTNGPMVAFSKANGLTASEKAKEKLSARTDSREKGCGVTISAGTGLAKIPNPIRRQTMRSKSTSIIRKCRRSENAGQAGRSSNDRYL